MRKISEYDGFMVWISVFLLNGRFLRKLFASGNNLRVLRMGRLAGVDRFREFITLKSIC
jgi:hypothetical protein